MKFLHRLAGIVGIGIVAALFIVAFQRMSEDALVVLIGVTVGVAASVPTSLLLIALLRREAKANEKPAPSLLFSPERASKYPMVATLVGSDYAMPSTDDQSADWQAEGDVWPSTSPG